MVRVTADAPANASPAVRAEAAAIRGARMNAYRVTVPQVRVLVAPPSISSQG